MGFLELRRQCGFHTRYDGELREPLVWRQGSQVSMCVARGSALLLSSYGRGILPQDALSHWFDPWVRKIPWRKEWQPTPVSLPGESQGRGSLVGCCLWGRTESDTTEATYPQGLWSGPGLSQVLWLWLRSSRRPAVSHGVGACARPPCPSPTP